MRNFKIALMAAAAALGVAATAHAADITVTDVEVGNGQGVYGGVTVGGYGNLWTTPIILKTSGGQTITVFCDDIPDHIGVGSPVSYPFNYGFITRTETGAYLGGTLYNTGTTDAEKDTQSKAISNIMGQIADIGVNDYHLGDEKGAIGAQLAIWSLEYGIVSTAADQTIVDDMTADLLIKDNGKGLALGLFSTDGHQNQIIGIPGAPEPSTWSLMILGVGGMGAALRTRRRKTVAA